MNLQQANPAPEVQIRSILKSSQFEQLQSRINVETFVFADTISEWTNFPNNLDNASGQRTAIGTALTSVTQQTDVIMPSMIMLISDGANNSGIDPVRVARLSSVPITAIGVGSEQASFDLMITDIVVNPIVYQGSRIPVEVNFRALDAKERPFEVILRDREGKALGRTQYTPTDSYSDGKISFEVPVDSAGRVQFRAEIPVLNGELTSNNNSKSVIVNVLSNRLRILVVSGTPDYGLGDLIRRLSLNPHVEINQRTEFKGGFKDGNWPDDKLLDKTDIVILHHFPTKTTSSEQLKEFARIVATKNLPICLIDGGDLDAGKLGAFAEMLPVTFSKRDDVSSGKISAIQRHAIIAPPDETDIVEKWGELPPLTGRVGVWKTKVEAESLAEFKFENGSREPAIVISESAGRKSAALLIRDLWKWGMISPGADGIPEPLIDRLVKWLAIRRSDKRVQLSFSASQYNTSEPVVFRVSCFDEGFHPIAGATIDAEITLNSENLLKTTLASISNGQYTGQFIPWKEGNYHIKAIAIVDGKVYGTDEGETTVEAYSVELLNTHQNKPLLQAIASNSGGKYVPLDSALDYIESINYPPNILQETNTQKLWGGWIHLIVVIGLLACEWFLRVRLGML